MLELPPALRTAFKDPLGPVYTDTDALLADAGRPITAVGDIVTYHLREAGHDPAVAILDGRTERAPVGPNVADALADDPAHRVENPAGTLTVELLDAVRAALASPTPTVIMVDGEEDLATLPAIVASPTGSSVVYGQPGEGMVLVEVTPTAQSSARDLLRRMDGDSDEALARLE